MNGEIEDVKMKREIVLKNYDITMNDIEEYRRNKPLIDRIRRLEQVINNLAKEIKSKEFEITTLEYKYMTGQQ